MTVTKNQQIKINQSRARAAKASNKINEIVAKNFKSSFMSDAKWRKVFTLLANSNYPISGYQWKFIDDERLFQTDLIKINELDEKHLKDGSNQPFIYKEIEWLEIITDNTKEITAELIKRGQFALDESELGFRIIGYSK